MKPKQTILTITLALIIIAIVLGWIMGKIDNEQVLWITGILSTSGVAAWNFVLKEDEKDKRIAAEQENKKLRIFNKSLEGEVMFYKDKNDN
ncbi:MAG: hypothetical protein CVU03_04970 [Bacteroidetes bacterium HGW-Bacteroidetes-2]|jgi:lipopolysaccharide biosynthesis regulator YciM|nr:MAG: hypothetical protein CVU03_04970 [Bacteroidetes bacterium HGW-Bacteroidetes-2]